ncbi:MAG: hypothetical protein K6E92_07895 [Lachnospiraceae bacterium]|nr:hypothetical protein [Lachnospiraceae bacterium]
MKLTFPKLYRDERPAEHASIAVPFAKGELTSEDGIVLKDGERILPVQTKVTSRYPDGSIRYLFVRFQADLPGNAKKELELVTPQKKGAEPESGISSDAGAGPSGEQHLRVTREGSFVRVSGGAGGLAFNVSDGSDHLFEELAEGPRAYRGEQFAGPFLTEENGTVSGIRLGEWQISESGPLVAVLRCRGEFALADAASAGENGVASENGSSRDPQTERPGFEVKLTAYAGKPWTEIAFRLINTTSEALRVSELSFSLWEEGQGADLSADPGMRLEAPEGEGANPVYETTGTGELERICTQLTPGRVRTCAANSNYKTKYTIGDGASVSRTVDAAKLIGEANEHFAEVFYGTFFADRTDARGGVCATVFQAQQNFPKGIFASPEGIFVSLVPRGENPVVFQSGISREQRFLLHFHEADTPLAELGSRSILYQMPDRPFLEPEVFHAAGVMPEIFVPREEMDPEVEISLITRADGHTRSYGMLHFGDAPDPNYTKQGRGKGRQVWTNNEYDFPHACALLYARTGERRFLDYLMASATHQMDVDVCHYSANPLLYGGQWEHTAGHTEGGEIVCSHQWVEGLLDLYHLTGEDRALETALGIGENVLRLLDTPPYQVSGENSARETGWALRTLTALYVETGDPKWVGKADWIVSQFREWKERYGGWLAPYTDNTLIRVPFMISVAAGSLYRYHCVFPSPEVKDMILAAVEDLLEECLLPNGLFYYKELPSLNRLGNNTLLLEALTDAYDLTGDVKYLRAGLGTFRSAIRSAASPMVGEKVRAEDAVLVLSGPPKNFAQSFLPLALYYRAAAGEGLLP